jgi:hypothetical protein
MNDDVDDVDDDRRIRLARGHDANEPLMLYSRYHNNIRRASSGISGTMGCIS